MEILLRFEIFVIRANVKQKIARSCRVLPIPPCKAIAIAIFDSVTVSIGELTSGVLREIFLVSADVRSTLSAVKSMYPGKIKKSSYVKPAPLPNSWFALRPSSGT